MSSMAVEPQPLYPVPPSFPCIDAAAWLALGLAKLMPITIGGLAGRTSSLDSVRALFGCLGKTSCAGNESDDDSTTPQDLGGVGHVTDTNIFE